MEILSISNIPRLFTALAEWGACLVFIFPNRRRFKNQHLVIISLVMLLLFISFHSFADTLPLYLWVPAMITAVLLMFSYIILTCKINIKTAIYYTAFAFVLAEFAASLEWQLHVFIFGRNLVELNFPRLLFLMGIYGLILISFGFLEAKRLNLEWQSSMTRKHILSSIIIAVIAFSVSNISFVSTSTPFSGQTQQEIFYIRTLVDLCALVILYALQEQFIQLHTQAELQSINSVLLLQYEQYRQFNESIELINHKYHDLKHQISIIRSEKNEDLKEEYLNQMEYGLEMYEAQFRTNNKVLDSILTNKAYQCHEYNINFTCVANGELINFIDTMDICSIFGNALDNAIESSRQISDIDKRLIRVAVYSKNNLLMIKFENYFENKFAFDPENIISTKPDAKNHGFGIKSIKHTIGKYNGTVAIDTENNWFVLCILIPINGD